MYTNLLVPTDGSALSDKAVTHAIGLAQALKARITAFYAAPDFPVPLYAEGIIFEPMSTSEYVDAAMLEAEKILDRVAAKAAEAGVECVKVHAVETPPWEAIISAARKSNCDAIVMASHGRSGLSALLLGSETTKVLTHSKLPVLVVR